MYFFLLVIYYFIFYQIQEILIILQIRNCILYHIHLIEIPNNTLDLLILIINLLKINHNFRNRILILLIHHRLFTMVNFHLNTY
jgi:hypothetical protein